MESKSVSILEDIKKDFVHKFDNDPQINRVCTVVINEFKTREKASLPTHKEKMQHLKEHDPILYSELTSDPCGSGYSDSFGIEIVFIIIAIVGIAFLVWK